MTQTRTFEIFCAVPPGLEPVLAAEMSELGWAGLRPEPGGVCFDGGWTDVWRANLWLRGASRVLARIDRFRVVHLSQLDKRAHKVAWADVLRPDVPVRVEASCRKSKIYHAGAAAQRVEAALRDALGVEISAEAAVTVRVRIDDNVCTLSVDTSGELLHRRGFKAEVNKAPMRETLAALFLRASGHDGTQPLLDPMCGSGTFIIEAAEMAAGLAPGRSRAFAFEQLKTFDAAAWTALKAETTPAEPTASLTGSDRDAGAIRISRANAERASVAAWTQFAEADARTLQPPPGEPGLVILNPPYGARIGNKKAMLALYAAFGANMLRQFRGWRVALVTSDPALARATRLPFREPGRPVDHGGIKIRLYQTGVLG
jgi:putative N6-adenine-specific DNA methylase